MGTILSKSFLDSLPQEDPYTSVQLVADEILKHITNTQGKNPKIEELAEAFTILDTLLENTSFSEEYYENFEGIYHPDDKQFPRIEAITDQVRNLVQRIRNSIEARKIEQKFATAKHKAELQFKNIFCYEFSESDQVKIQSIINELRGLIAGSEFIEDEHKKRLLNRLEKLQQELYKKMSDLDRFWGLIGDAGVAIGKFGTDAKPIVDRIRELCEIVWKVQASTEGLPDSTPLPQLENRDNDS